MKNKKTDNSLNRKQDKTYKVFFRTLANMHRLKIINLLREGDKTVTEICKALSFNQTTVSHNLSRLKLCQFVFVKKNGKERIYSLNKETIRPLMDIIDKHTNNYCKNCLDKLNRWWLMQKKVWIIKKQIKKPNKAKSIEKRGKLAKIILIFLALIFAYLLFKRFYTYDVIWLADYITSFGILTPLAYIIIMALAIVISPIPSFPLAVASGIIFGPFLGVLYTVIGAEIGAIISFYIARKFGAETIKYLTGKDIRKINVLHSKDEKYLAWLIFATRLFPFIQFDVISYGAGLTNISMPKFAVATFLGMIPMTLVFVYFGKILLVGSLWSFLLTVIMLIIMLNFHKIFRKYKK